MADFRGVKIADSEVNPDGISALGGTIMMLFTSFRVDLQNVELIPSIN